MASSDDESAGSKGATSPGGDPLDPAEVVMVQDGYFTEVAIDMDAWSDTMFFPHVLVHQGGTVVVEDVATFRQYMSNLWVEARRLGVARLRTRIQPQVQQNHGMAIIAGSRDRLDGAGQVRATTSMTWTVVWSDKRWRINQILFNDARQNPSLMTLIAVFPGERT